MQKANNILPYNKEFKKEIARKGRKYFELEIRTNKQSLY